MRIGIYGGTFNPPHLGHIRGVEYALTELELDKLLVIPTGVPPHKGMDMAGPAAAQRLEMLRLTLGRRERLEISSVELERKGPSYTYDTVMQLRESYSDGELILCVGSDMFPGVENWYEGEKLLKQVSLAVFYRGLKGERETVARTKEKLENKGVRVYITNNPVVDISSTNLRRMLVFRCADPFLHPKTLEYIRDNGLYHTQRDLRHLSMEALEKTVTELLDPGRVRHVLGCRDTAAELAARWGVDKTDAARAGLLHDITKALDGPLQLTLCEKYGIILDRFSQTNPKTLHALTGSLVAQYIFGENPAVVKAICSHTTGKAQMNTLEKIIYVADYMEPNRDFPGVERLRNLAYSDLDKALKLGLEMTIAMLTAQNREISPESLDALAWLNSAGV